jgi:NRPS condensation-like uncharacterized protein
LQTTKAGLKHRHSHTADRTRIWYPLDNSAKIFPAIKTGKVSAVFRLSIMLREKITPSVLLQALVDIMPRFPNFSMKLKPGLFWYYLEPNKASPQIYEDTRYPCLRLYRKNNNGYLFRVLYHENRISLEVFHSLTDGTGGLAFLKTLTARYLTLLLGLAIEPAEGVLDIGQTPPESEMEDSYKKYARPTRQRQPIPRFAYHLGGTVELSGRINVITASMPLSDVKKLAAGYGVTLNDLLVACYMYAFCRLQHAEEHHRMRPVVIAVPVNMRRFYPSQTLRNFFLRVTPSVNQAFGEFSFQEILAEVHHYMQVNTNEKYLNARMFNNLRNEKIMAARLIPLYFKNRILKIAYLFYGDSRTTSTLTNVGPVRLPAAMKPHIAGMEVLMGPSLNNFINCAILSYDDTLNLTFSRRIAEPLIERLFCTQLVQLGVPVHVSSNQADLQYIR